MPSGKDLALWIIAISLAIIAVAAIGCLVSILNYRIRGPRKGSRFHQKVLSALQAGEIEKALSLALEQQKSAPMNPHSWYDAALCYYSLERWQEALVHFKKAQDMAPTWEKGYTGPYIQAIEKRLQGAPELS